MTVKNFSEKNKKVENQITPRVEGPQEQETRANGKHFSDELA